MDTVAERWAATDELKLDRWSAEIAREVLSELSVLAREAREAGQRLCFWWSL